MEKRSIERHLMEEFIHLDGGEGAIPARTIDVSRNGMRVVVNRPHGFDEIHRVSVNLPGAGGDGIPCRIRRSEMGTDQWEIGLEFDGETDARMLLIERWLESLEKRRPETDSAPTESRQVPRTRCTINEISCSGRNLEIISAEDISVDGMLIHARGKASSGDLLSLTMILPEIKRPIRFTARVAYVVETGSDLPFSAGISVEEMKETDRNRLRNFIVDISSGVAMLEYHKLLEKEEPSEEFRIVGEDAAEMMRTLVDEGLTLNLLDEEGLRILETRVENISENGFQAAAPEMAAGSAFFSFTRETSSFSFSAKRMGWKDGIGEFRYPDSIYRGEKRAGARQSMDGNIELAFSSPDNLITGHVVDSSRRGLLCRIPGAEFSGVIPTAGEALNITVNGNSIPGEVRHIVKDKDEDGNPIYLIGLETGIRRREPETTIYDKESWKESWNGPQRALEDSDLVSPRKVSYTDQDGLEIAALLHLHNSEEPCTAVVIPPAFGKKKEALAPLALTLMTHFASAGENIAVLRYDGINRPGESFNSNSQVRRGYEMLGYRINQGYTDLEASMQWVKNNDIFKAKRTVLVSTSMAALDAKRLQATPGAPKADYWISLMGVSSAQCALTNILGGLDVVANHRMGLPIGTMGMLGQLIDMDRMAAGMTRLGYATVADARESMSRIESPVTWLYGAYDKWMIPDEIRDIMSVAAPGDREIIEIPTAHNLRTSEDAISAFQLISDAILRRLMGKKAPIVAPDKNQLLALLTRERESVAGNEKLDARQYWKGYLVGENEGGEGYDFYARLAEFKDFLQTEATLLNPQPGESIADMGCGTGLVSETLLKHLASNGENLKGTRFTAVDLVDEALIKAKKKFHRLCSIHGNLEDVEDSWLAMNLEPDPLAALRGMIDKNETDIELLRGRVKGLKSETLDRFSELPGKIGKKVLSGALMSPDSRFELEQHFPSEDTFALEDLNRAARFIIGNLYEEDLKPSRRMGTGRLTESRLAQIRTSDILQAVLDFGDWGRQRSLSFPDAEFDAISASLFLSYLFAPWEAVREFARMLKPGGRLLISSMKPDSDISGIFTAYINEQVAMDSKNAMVEDRERNLWEARSMLNEAASLFSLEEDGWFHFFDKEQLIDMMEATGFIDINVHESLGDPSQAIIVVGNLKSV